MALIANNTNADCNSAKVGSKHYFPAGMDPIRELYSHA